jgi:hypothetical protein
MIKMRIWDHKNEKELGNFNNDQYNNSKEKLIFLRKVINCNKKRESKLSTKSSKREIPTYGGDE